jgi:excisionase family DNA binding protein
MKPPRKSAAAARVPSPPTLTVKVQIDPLVEVVGRHVKLTPRARRMIETDLAQLFRGPAQPESISRASGNRATRADPVLSTQEAADLVGVSRPYIVARIEAGEIALHQQVGNQRRVLRSAVESWLKRERAKQRRALGTLGDDLDAEIFAR